MGPFPSSFSNLYILLVVDYVSEWVEAIPTRTNDARVVASFLHNHIFTQFGTPWALITDGGTRFCNKLVDSLLRKYCNTPKYTLVVFNMFRVFCKRNLNVS